MKEFREGNHILMKRLGKRQSNIGIFLMCLCFLCALYSLPAVQAGVLSTLSGEALSSQGITTSPDFDKDALLDKVKETSLMNDIRWIENKGQLSINSNQKPVTSNQNKDFYDSIRYYAKTPWGYFLIEDDNAVILNFIKPVKYTKDNVIVLVEQPDWRETAKKELDLSSKKIAKLKEEGFVEANGKEIWLETAYRETRNQLPESRKEPGDFLEGFNSSYRSYVLEVSVDGKKAIRIEPQGERAEKQSFFKGKDSSKWVSGLTTYNEMWAYFGEGVVFRFYAKEGKKIDPERFQGTSGVEKEVIIPEGIKLEDVYLTYTSDDDFELSVEDDKLLINFDGYEFSEQVPFAYVIDENDERKEVKANYVLLPTTYNLLPVTYHLSPANDEHGSFSKVCQIKSEWNGDGTFIFDPLLASTYLGGEFNDVGRYIALDSSGNVYVTGHVSSTSFPATSGAYDETGDGSTSYSDFIISKLTSDLSTLIASTYLGGADNDYNYSFTLDASDNVYVTGRSSSTDFPTTSGVYDETGDGSTSYYDIIISKLTSDLSALIASTYLAGGNYDAAFSITLDASDNVYITGYSKSTDFPTTGGVYDETGDGSITYYDGVISKLTSDLTTLIASTYIGGASLDCGYSITLDASNNVYISGCSYSTDFPTTSGAYDETGDGNPGYGDGVISKFTSDLTTLSASTYLGGVDDEEIYSITFDASNNVYVAGYSKSTNFPTTSGAYDETGDGSINYNDGVISKFTSDLTTLSASTYLGGAHFDISASITLDASDNVYVASYSISTDFPTTSGAYDETGDGTTSRSDSTISKLTSDLTTLSASTYLGGTKSEYVYSITLDDFNNIYLVGYSKSTDFPTTSGAYDETGDGSTSYNDIFISKLSPDLSCKEYWGTGTGAGDEMCYISTDTTLGYSTKTQVGFTTHPSNSTAGTAFGVQPVVAVQDQYGNTVLSATDVVTLAIDNNPGNGTLSGTASVAASSGVATFSGLSIDEPGNGYTLLASTGAATTDTSNAFNIGGPPWVSAISGSQLSDETKRIQITYTACDIESESCNLTTAASQAQYSQDNFNWSNATLSGTTTSITASPTGTQHTDLYWEAGTDLDDTEDPTVYFRLKLNDGTDTSVNYATSSSFAVDTKSFAISEATHFDVTPVAGDTTISLGAVWTETLPATSMFYYAQNGEVYDGGTAGTTGSASPTATITLGAALTGVDYFSKIKSTLTDQNGSVVTSEDTTDVAITPYTPLTPTVASATPTTVDVTVVPHASEDSLVEYAIYVSPAVGGGNYVQANGSVGASEAWQTVAIWGTKTVTGLDSGTDYTFKIKSRNYYVNSTESEWSSESTVTTLISAALNIECRYASATQVEVLVWFEEGGQIITSGLTGTATVNLYDADGSGITVTGNTDAAADSQGIYSVTPTRSSGTFTSNATYYAAVSVPYNNKTYNKTVAFQVDIDTENIAAILEDTATTLPQAVSTIEGKVDTLDTVLDNILTDTGTTLPSTLTTIEGKIDTVDSILDNILTDTGTTLPSTLTTIEGKIDTVDGIVDSILTDTGTTLPGDISTAKTDIIAELTKGPKAKILNRPTTASAGDTLTIRYKTNSGLVPVIDVYDAGNTQRVNSLAMTEIGTTGIYEYDLTLVAGWGTGDFTIICSEGTTSSIDSMTLEVEVASASTTYNLSTIESKVDVLDTNVDTLVTNIASIKSTVEDTNSDLATVQSDVNSIITKWGSYTASDLLSDTDNLSAYIGTPDDTSGTDTVFGNLAQVYDATGTISSASTYAQNAYDEIQSLRSEIGFNGKTTTAYEMLVGLRDTLSDLQASMGVIPESDSARIEEIYNSLSQSLSELREMMVSDGLVVTIPEETEEGEELDEVAELNNLLDELKAILEVAKIVMEKKVEEPVVRSWFEMK